MVVDGSCIIGCIIRYSFGCSILYVVELIKEGQIYGDLFKVAGLCCSGNGLYALSHVSEVTKCFSLACS